MKLKCDEKWNEKVSETIPGSHAVELDKEKEKEKKKDKTKQIVLITRARK